MLILVLRNVPTHLSPHHMCHVNLIAGQEARMLTQAEMCSVFLVDKVTNELVAKVFDGTLVDINEKTAEDKGREIRIPINKGIAGKTHSRSLT